MSDRARLVLTVQEHLRCAASLLAQQQFNRAVAEVDAALTLDPASLQAAALRERIEKARMRTRMVEPEPESPPMQPNRFVPTGVNAESWFGFEQRIQERRYRALIDTLRSSIESGNAVAARVALEEARELRPDGPELADLADRVSILPVAIPVESPNAFLRSRALGAVMLLVVGMSLLVGLDWVRLSQDAPAPVAAAPEPSNVIASELRTAPPPVTLVPETTPAEEPAAPAPEPTTIAANTEPRRTAPDTPVATVGRQPAPPVEEPVIAIASARPALAAPGPIQSQRPVIDRETPDDFVAPPQRREAVVTPPPAAAPRTASAGREPAAAPPVVIREPAPAPPVTREQTAVAAMVAPSRGSEASAAALPVAAVTPPRVDETRVAQVLNQYARAYGQLDASAARRVWPSVDERALARAFAGLESQDVSFDNCEIAVRGETANASCRGRASYVGKVGRRVEQTETRLWRFELRRDGDAWKIETAEARRAAAY